MSETTQLATVPTQDGRLQVMDIIRDCATNPDFDVDKMRALLDMRRELDAQVAEQAYNDAMRSAQEKMRSVVRDKMNTHTKAKYATLEKLHEICKHVWLGEGFSLSSHSDLSPIAGHYRVITTCRHIGGHKTEHFLDAPPDDAGPNGAKNKTPIQALGSTVSYVRRYLDLMIFDITLVGEDRDGNRHEPSGPAITEDQSLEMQAFIDEHRLPVPGFLELMGVKAVGEILASEHVTAWTALRRKAAELKAKRARQ